MHIFASSNADPMLTASLEDMPRFTKPFRTFCPHPPRR